ncbi:MAG TPA: Maf family protein [Patescibacteria group bacterium]
MTVILASQSPQRKALMETLGIPFEIMPAALDEKAITAATQVERAEKVARAKAEVVSQQLADAQPAIIIAADTYVVDGEAALEKPESLDEARDMLRRQSGRTLVAYSGFCYLDQTHGIDYSTTVKTESTFRELSDEEIDRYVTTQPVRTWSAAFSPAYVEGMALVAAVNGSLTSFTHGLPMEELIPLLRQSGVIPGDQP